MNELIVPIVAVSGAGKDANINELIERYPDRFRKFISTTTRAMREGEVEGVDYYFIDDATYDQWLSEDRFVLSIEFAGARYGTLRTEITGHGKTLLMLVVEEVALAMKDIADNVHIIALDVDEATADARMTLRGDERAKIEARLAADAKRRPKIAEAADVIIDASRPLAEVVDDLDKTIAAFED